MRCRASRSIAPQADTSRAAWRSLVRSTRVADAASVGEVGLSPSALDVVAEDRLGLGGQLITLLGEHPVADGHQVVHLELGEVEVMGDS